MTSNDVSHTTPRAGHRAGPLTGASAGVALLVVLFASFMDLLDATIVTVAAPAIAAGLGASESQLQWMLAAYVLALRAGLIVGGRIGGAAGIAVLATIFFASLDAPAAGASRLGVHADAFAAVLPAGIALHVLAAALMPLLPRAAASQGELEAVCHHREDPRDRS